MGHIRRLSRGPPTPGDEWESASCLAWTAGDALYNEALNLSAHFARRRLAPTRYDPDSGVVVQPIPDFSSP
jgi:hypothetical protein